MSRPPTLMMVVAHLPPTIGGVEQYAFNLARTLVTERGWRVVLVSTRRRDQDVVATEALVARTPGLSVSWLPAARLVSNTPVGLGWSNRLRRIAARENVDVVNAHAPVPGLADVTARALAHLPFVLTYHAGPMRKGRRLLDAGLAAYEREVLTRTVMRSSAVVAASPWVRDQLRGTTDVVTPAVDPERFSPDGGGRPRAGRVLFVGSLEASARYKGLDVLIDAIDRLGERSGATLDIIGDGTDRDRLIRIVGERGLTQQIRFRGPLQGDELVEAYRDAAVLAVPSTFDNFPTVVLEAMACAVPVVSSDVGSLPELVEGNAAGISVPAGDADALAAALREVVDDPGRAARMGLAGRDVVERRLGLSAQARAMAGVLDRVLASSRRTKVAVVTPQFPPDVGGTASYAAWATTLLAHQPDLDVTVLAPALRRRTPDERHDGVRVIRLATWFHLSSTPINPLWPIVLRRWFRQLGTDVVLAHSPLPYLPDMAVLASGRRPVVLTYHSGSLLKGGGAVDVLLRAYERFVLPRVFDASDALVAVSPVSLAASAERSVLIPPGVDTARFRLPRDDERRDTSVLYVGRIQVGSRWKGLHELIEALPAVVQRVPDAMLEMVGDGDDVAALQRRAAALGVAEHVRWHGALAGEQVAERYRRAAVTVLPSLTESESFGMVLVEAMASGCAVVGSDVGGIPFVVRDGVDGRLVPTGDVVALAETLAALLGDEAELARLGENGRRAALERWDWRHQELRTLEVVRGVLAG